MVYCYYGGIDKIAHERGFGPFYEAELRFADQIVAETLAVLPPGAALLAPSIVLTRQGTCRWCVGPAALGAPSACEKRILRLGVF